MRILKFIYLCVVTLVYANPTIASSFKYATTFTCGPKELEGFSNFRNLRERYWYYFFNIAADGEFIVLNDDIQYKSFEETELIQLFHQNGGTFTVSHEEVLGNNVYRFKDISKNPIWIKTLIIDQDTNTPVIYAALTFVKDRYYLKSNVVFNPLLVEDRFYTLKVLNGTSIVYRDMIFCTDQVISTFSINKDQFVKNVTTNEYIVI